MPYFVLELTEDDLAWVAAGGSLAVVKGSTIRIDPKDRRDGREILCAAANKSLELDIEPGTPKKPSCMEK